MTCSSNPAASSKANAVLNNLCSENFGPINCNPKGKPFAAQSAGSVITGMPAWVQGRFITGSPVGAFACAAEQRLGLLRSELDFAPVDSIFAGGLHEFLDALQVKMNKIDESVAADFFARTETN